MIKEITSAQNRTYKYIKSLKSKKGRTSYGQYTVEGIKSVKDALAAKAPIDCIVISDSFCMDFEFGNIIKIPQNIFLPLCDTETPQGILAVINMPKNTDIITDDRLYMYCDHITDPGNMGTIIRICDAVDCTLLLSEETVDIYNPKTVRASMGSFFHTRIVNNVSAARLRKLQNDGYRLIAGALGKNTADYSVADYGDRAVIIIGNEANGVCEEILEMADVCAKIPIWGRAESLNAAVAAALLIYEAKRNIGNICG